MMKIAVLGAGAMGSLYGGYLSRKNDVCLVDVWREHVDAINARGLDIDEAGGSITHVSPRAVTSAQDAGEAGLVIVFVKSINTAEALESAAALIGSETIVLTLQNGYGNGDDIARFVPRERVVVGTTSHGCTMRGPGHIFHAGSGPTHVGALGRDQSAARTVAAVLSESGFETDCSGKVMELVWGKLFVNIAINAVTALLDVPNGFVQSDGHARECAALLVREAVEVANASGMSFDADAEIENALAVAVNTGGNCSSMRADVLARRRTEIGRINGAVVKKAGELGLDAPYNRMVSLLIGCREDTYLN